MLRRSKLIVASVVLALGFVLALLPSRLNDQLKRLIGWVNLPLVGMADGIGRAGHRSRAYVTPRSVLLKEIDRLRETNRRIRIEAFQAESIHQENQRLRALVGWHQLQPWPLRLGKVFVEEPSNWWRGVHLNLGTTHGVQVDDPVLTDRGLIGKVVAVGRYRSRVALLGDSNCQVAAELKTSGQAGIITTSSEGTLNRRIVELKHVPSDAPLTPGEAVVTSGTGGVFPRGIPIGRLIDSQSYDFGLYSEARVRLDADLERLRYAWVIMRRPAATEEAP